MTINSHKVGPGVLTLGASDLAVQSQLTSCSLVPSEKVKETDPIPVLSGEELEGSSSASLTYRLKGQVLQDGKAAGVVAFSWINSGDEVDFTFKPNNTDSASFEGVVRVVPFTIGGDVSKTDPAQSDFDWVVIGTPVPTWDPA